MIQSFRFADLQFESHWSVQRVRRFSGGCQDLHRTWKLQNTCSRGADTKNGNGVDMQLGFVLETTRIQRVCLKSSFWERERKLPSTFRSANLAQFTRHERHPVSLERTARLLCDRHHGGLMRISRCSGQINCLLRRTFHLRSIC